MYKKVKVWGSGGPTSCWKSESLEYGSIQGLNLYLQSICSPLAEQQVPDNLRNSKKCPLGLFQHNHGHEPDRSTKYHA